jgi:peptide/nickel transport system substrate-binding protein
VGSESDLSRLRATQGSARFGRLSRRRFMALTGGAGGAVLSGASLAALLEACSQGTSTQSTSTNQKLSMAVFQEPDTLDPVSTGLVVSATVGYAISDPLVWKFTGKGSKLYYPGLATSWDVSADATTYTFKLRKDVKFHDGTQFDANAVKATFDHIVDPATKSRQVGSLGPYKETRVVDQYTAQVVFSAPNAAFTNNMTGLSMISPAALAKYGADFGHNPVGTGPFKFKEYVVGQRVSVTRNPDYNWGPSVFKSGPPTLTDITFRILPDAGARFNALQTGEVQLAPNLNPQDVQKLQHDSKYKFYNVASTGMPWNIMVNAQKPPTDDVNVRKALQFATDQQAIIKALYFNLYQAAHSVFTPGTPGYDSSFPDMYKHDTTQAGQLLDKAGWTKGSNGMRQKGGQALHLNFINISGYGFDGISQLMQAQFRDVGIATDISDQSFPAVATTYNKGDQHLADFFFYALDPYFLRTLFACDQIASGFNWEHYCNPSLDSMVDQANGTGDETKRNDLYKQANKVIMDAAVIIPLYNSTGLFLGTSSLKGLDFTVNALPLFHAASM